MDQVVAELVTLWAVIDPIGTLPVFIAVASHFSPARQRAIAIRATVASLLVLMLFIAAAVLCAGLLAFLARALIRRNRRIDLSQLKPSQLGGIGPKAGIHQKGGPR